jgi:hypothetical protein
MKVLISSPRTGSSCYYEHIEHYNLSLPNVKKIGPEEFLDPNQMSNMSLAEKIYFLNVEKHRGVNYTFKHHINYLKKDIDYYNGWFKNFYKDDEIIVLKRKDMWKWFMSFLFQDCIGWKHATIQQNKYDNDYLRTSIDSNWTNYKYDVSLDQFLQIKLQLDEVEGNVVYYEDLILPYSKYEKISSMINYESYFENIEDIKVYYEKKTQSTIHSTI